jgi:hypothetical protein
MASRLSGWARKLLEPRGVFVCVSPLDSWRGGAHRTKENANKNACACAAIAAPPAPPPEEPASDYILSMFVADRQGRPPVEESEPNGDDTDEEAQLPQNRRLDSDTVGGGGESVRPSVEALAGGESQSVCVCKRKEATVQRRSFCETFRFESREQNSSNSSAAEDRSSTILSVILFFGAGEPSQRDANSSDSSQTTALDGRPQHGTVHWLRACGLRDRQPRFDCLPSAGH